MCPKGCGSWGISRVPCPRVEKQGAGLQRRERAPSSKAGGHRRGQILTLCCAFNRDFPSWYCRTKTNGIITRKKRVCAERSDTQQEGREIKCSSTGTTESLYDVEDRSASYDSTANDARVSTVENHHLPAQPRNKVVTHKGRGSKKQA